MPSSRKKPLLLALLVVAIGGGAVVYAWRWFTPRRGSLVGTIVRLDPDARTGVLSFIHPKTGERFELRGELSPDCGILVDGHPAAIDALHAGDRVRAEGLFYRSGRVVATRLVVQSNGPQETPLAEASTRPARPPAGTTGQNPP